MNLPPVDAGTGKRAKKWRKKELEAQAFAYTVAGGFPIPTGRHRIDPYEQFSYRVVRSTK